MLALFAGCAGPKRREPSSHPVVIKQPQINISSLEKQIHRLINEERRKYHLTTLGWDSDLSAIARKHSRDMSRRNYFAHNSPDGHDFSYRYKQAGYQCALRVDSRVYMGAENILQNNLYDSVTTVNGQAFYDWNSHERLAETTVQGWMNSPGHRQNILMPLWKNEGIGIFISPDDKVYITQNFC
jgi:uncharacterized protein YkwD